MGQKIIIVERLGDPVAARQRSKAALGILAIQRGDILQEQTKFDPP